MKEKNFDSLLVEKIHESKKRFHRTNKHIANRLYLSVRTFYRRLEKPEEFRMEEILSLAKYFHWPDYETARLIGGRKH